MSIEFRPSKLQALITKEGLVPGDNPGEWVKPGRGIDMNRIKFNTVPIVPDKPEVVSAPTVKNDDGLRSNDGSLESGIFALRRREQLKDRMARILRADRRAIGRQTQLEKEAGHLVDAMSKNPGLRNNFNGAVRRLPAEEQAYVAQVLREKGDPSKKIIQNVDAVRRAEEEKTRLLHESGYAPIGSGFGDSMIVTGDGVQLFVAGMGNGDNDTTPDAAFPFAAVVSGRLKFEIAGRNETDRRASKRRWGVFPETVRATDTVTGKIYELRGVKKPDDMIDNLFRAAQAITAGDQAAHDTMQVLSDHPEMLE